MNEKEKELKIENTPFGKYVLLGGKNKSDDPNEYEFQLFLLTADEKCHTDEEDYYSCP